MGEREWVSQTMAAMVSAPASRRSCTWLAGGWRVRPAIVMVSAVGLALKDHGRARTLKGLRDGALAAHRPAMMTLQGPCPAMVL